MTPPAVPGFQHISDILRERYSAEAFHASASQCSITLMKIHPKKCPAQREIALRHLTGQSDVELLLLALQDRYRDDIFAADVAEWR